MGLFGKKKRESPSDSEAVDNQMPQPVLPEFPDIPENFDDESSQFPGYGPSITDIRDEVTKEEEFTVPERKPAIGPKMSQQAAKTVESPRFELFASEKPLFIKVTNYKEALKHLDMLKTKVGDAESILREIGSIREEEEKKIEEWRRDLNSVKEKLLSVDKYLFEV